MKTVYEKLLENRIARLEKLIGNSKRAVNESLPRTGMTLGEIMRMFMGTMSNRQTLDDIESTTDIHFQVADAAGLEDEYEGLDFIADHWRDKCYVFVNKGMGDSGSDEVNISFADITISLDWLNEDEDAYESCKRSVRRTRH